MSIFKPEGIKTVEKASDSGADGSSCMDSSGENQKGLDEPGLNCVKKLTIDYSNSKAPSGAGHTGSVLYQACNEPGFSVKFADKITSLAFD